MVLTVSMYLFLIVPLLSMFLVPVPVPSSEFVMEATDADFATEFVQQQMVITSRKHLFIQGPTIHLSSLRLFWGVAFCLWYWQRGC